MRAQSVIVVAFIGAVFAVPGVLSLASGTRSPGDKAENVERVTDITERPGSPEPPSNYSDGVINDETPSWWLGQARHEPWSHYQVINDRQIRVFYETGAETCYGVMPTLKETAETIEIGVMIGLRPDAVINKTCPAYATQASTVVDLQNPIGNRTIQEG